MSQKNYIVAENFISGSFERARFAGNLMQRKLNFRGFFVAKSKKRCVFRDRVSQTLSENGEIREEAYREYLASAEKMLAETDLLSIGTDESVMETLHRLRLSYFESKVFQKFFLSDRETVHAVEGIDQSALTEKLWKKKAILFYLSEKIFISDFLSDLSRALAEKKRIFCIAFPSAAGIMPDEEIFSLLLGEKAEFITFLHAEDNLFSLDFSKLEYNEELAGFLDREEAALFSYGEDALMASRALRLPTCVFVKPQGLPSMALTNLSTRSLASRIYVPARFDILPFVPVIERTRLTYYQLALLAEKYGEGVYFEELNSLIRKEPRLFLNLYDDHLPPVIKNDFVFEGESLPRAREEYFLQKLNSFPGIRYIHTAFDKKTLEKVSVDWEGKSAGERLMVDCVIASPEKSTAVLCTGSPVSPRKLFFDSQKEETAIIANFTFFFTEKLILAYNARLKDRVQEQIKKPVGHIDYKLFYDETGERHETIPLFKKPCIAAKKGGGFASFSFSLRGGAITLPTGHSFSFDEKAVNPEGNPSDVAVYTPMLSMADEKEDSAGYMKFVGENRLNITLIGEDVICIREGAVSLPCIGAVLSLSGARAEALRGTLSACDSEGYYRIPEPGTVKMKLSPPQGFSEEEWEEFSWVYGGGIPLTENGAYIARENFQEIFRRAGWLTPLSRQSQESAQHDLSVHPRTAVGVTKSGELFLIVISGRTRVSAGADYLQLCEIVRRIISNVDILACWDGGGSSVLGLLEDNVFTEISYPSPSDDTVAGMVRPINSMIKITI